MKVEMKSNTLESSQKFYDSVEGADPMGASREHRGGVKIITSKPETNKQN